MKATSASRPVVYLPHPQPRGVAMPAIPYPVPPCSRSLTLTAWGVTLLVSSLPDIAWAELTGGVPAWLVYLKLGLLLALALATLVWKQLRPLRNFFIALAALFALSVLRERIDFSLP